MATAPETMLPTTKDFMEYIKLPEYIDNFETNEVTIEMLPEMTNDDLKDIGITKLGHRKIILKATLKTQEILSYILYQKETLQSHPIKLILYNNELFASELIKRYKCLYEQAVLHVAAKEATKARANERQPAIGKVEVFEHGGKKYLRDPNTNKIYDYTVFLETGDAKNIGVYYPNTDTINIQNDSQLNRVSGKRRRCVKPAPERTAAALAEMEAARAVRVAEKEAARAVRVAEKEAAKVAKAAAKLAEKDAAKVAKAAAKHAEKEAAKAAAKLAEKVAKAAEMEAAKTTM